MAKALEKHVPAGVTQVENQQYHTNDKDGYLDVFYPEKTTAPLPTVVWVHGGAWVSGDKNDIDNYLKIIASHGYTAIGVDYTVAPEAQYPTPLLQLNDALDYIQKNAEQLHINSDKIVLAGDSAGSQVVAQMANIITSSSYANEINIKPTLASNKLKAMLLNCGAYDLALPDYSGPFGGLLHTVLWAYSGTKDFLHDPKLKTASVVNYVTPDFPPSFITAGNIDPLLPQSTEFAKKLQSLGVSTSTLFYPTNHKPELNHEYQFDLDTDEGQQALKQMIDFLHERTYS
ncbi:MAG TPA: alpha/beta hydrolase [Nevskiaceae bacterium]|nr:alpha/beta hydrolase [Nevskiaceae bacterium]